MEEIMALPIRPTPKLNKEETQKFCAMVEEQSTSVYFPKSNRAHLERVREMAINYALKQSKYNK